MKPFHLLASIALATGLCATAWAGPVSREFGPNLITNGGFEATTTVAGSGWSASGFTLEGYDYEIDTDPADAHGGSHSFAGGGIGAPGFISQTFATNVGRAYNIHFWLTNPSGFADGTEVDVLWNGVVVYTATDILAGRYVEIVVDPLATGATSRLSIGLRDDNFFLNVDDISVRAVPEPGALALLAAGALGAGLARRRRKTA